MTPKMVIAAATNMPAAESRFHRIRVGPRLRCVELGGVVRHAQAPIIQEAREGISADEAINDGLGHVVVPKKQAWRAACAGVETG
jgi:hypothetical protein